MVYEYETNEEFIKKADELLSKLNKKNLWDKDTLVIGLDKSVRPLAYTLRKLSSEKHKKSPDFRFINFSSNDFYGIGVYYPEQLNKNISHYLKEKINPKKLSQYKKILILDNYTHTGDSLRDTSKIVQDYFSNVENKPAINYATIKSNIHPTKKFKEKLTFVDLVDNLSQINKEEETGIRDKYSSEKIKIMQESMKVQDKKIYKEFIKNRKQLGNDIKNYLHEIPLEKMKKQNFLEKILQSFSFIFLFLGLFIGYNGITGNIIGNSFLSGNFLGTILIILGIMGLVFHKKLL